MFKINCPRMCVVRCLKIKTNHTTFIQRRSKNYPKIPGWYATDIEKIYDEQLANNKRTVAELCEKANACDRYVHQKTKTDTYVHDSKTCVGVFAKQIIDEKDIDGHACPKPMSGMFHQGTQCPYCRGTGATLCHDCRVYGKLCYDKMDAHKCGKCDENGTTLCIMCSGTGDSPLL